MSQTSLSIRPSDGLNCNCHSASLWDILKALRIPPTLVLETRFDRPNLKHEVMAKTKKPLKQLGELLKNHFAYFCGMVYCLSKGKCVDVVKCLNDKCSIMTM
ncbi:hypothetical protein BT93_B1453 [Corymbia citriodora subsp. variegata]|nr:hypothetical protein BT93_B1453 [Corymbia citriodora subsp. variegata]